MSSTKDKAQLRNNLENIIKKFKVHIFYVLNNVLNIFYAVNNDMKKG